MTLPTLPVLCGGHCLEVDNLGKGVLKVIFRLDLKPRPDCHHPHSLYNWDASCFYQFKVFTVITFQNLTGFYKVFLYFVKKGFVFFFLSLCWRCIKYFFLSLIRLSITTKLLNYILILKSTISYINTIQDFSPIKWNGIYS